MLESITLENFKGFKKLNNLRLKPVTIFCGINSCGKSSILQSLLLLKQTMESKNPNQTLLLNGRFVHLGTFRNIIFEKKTKNNVSFSLCFKLTKADLRLRKDNSIPIRFLIETLISNRRLEQNDVEYLINFYVSLKTSLGAQASFLKPIVVDQLKFEIESRIVNNHRNVKPEISGEVNLMENSSYELKWKNLYQRFGRSDKINKKTGNLKDIHIEFANLFPIGIGLKSKEVKRPPDILYVFFRLNELLQTIFSTYTYIGPLREEPSRRYIYEDEIVEIGIKGENAAYIYLAEKDKRIDDHFFYNSRTDSFHKQTSVLNLQRAVNRWLNLMKIKNFQPEPTNEIIYLNLNSSSARKTRVNIADVGFGVSQIFPIILEGLRMDKGESLLLEQPEIHLHPNLQMQMADYFISLALAGKRVIVETHSDHIINRLVRRIVEDKDFGLKHLIGVYFIKPTEGGATFEEICIDDKQGIINWPEDFFDQTATEQEKILRAGLRKRQGIKK